MHDAFIRIAGVRLRFRTAGQGPAVALLHGWALDLDMWQPQFADLSDHCQLIALDRRGFGFSSGKPDIAEDVEDLRSLLDALGIAGATIVGMSQGARVAMGFACRHPDRVSSLILDGAPSLATMSTGTQEEIPYQDYRVLVRERGMAAFREQWLRHPLMRLHNAAAAPLVREMVERYPGHDLAAEDASTMDVAIDLTRIRQPAAIVNGEYDSAARIAAGKELSQVLPNGRHTLVPGAGHLSNLDNPSSYNELLLDCLRCDLEKSA